MNQLSGKTLRGMIAVMAMAGICFLAGNGMAVMVSAVTSQKQNAGQPLREANWGLSFQEEGKAPVGRPGPCTPWGKPALGLKTRKHKKASNKMIVRRRNGKAIS